MEFRNINILNISLNRSKNLFVNIGLIILALLIAKNIYGKQVKQIADLKNNKETELKKNALINDIGGAEKRINAFQAGLHQRDTSAIINSITQIASSAGVEIASVRPEQEREFEAYNKISVRLSAVAANYHVIGNFISKLENAAQLYIIDYITITSYSPTQMGTGEIAGSERLACELIVTAVVFKG